MVTATLPKSATDRSPSTYSFLEPNDYVKSDGVLYDSNNKNTGIRIRDIGWAYLIYKSTGGDSGTTWANDAYISISTTLMPDAPDIFLTKLHSPGWSLASGKSWKGGSMAFEASTKRLQWTAYSAAATYANLVFVPFIVPKKTRSTESSPNAIVLPTSDTDETPLTYSIPIGDRITPENLSPYMYAGTDGTNWKAFNYGNMYYIYLSDLRFAVDNSPGAQFVRIGSVSLTEPVVRQTAFLLVALVQGSESTRKYIVNGYVDSDGGLYVYYPVGGSYTLRLFGNIVFAINKYTNYTLDTNILGMTLPTSATDRIPLQKTICGTGFGKDWSWEDVNKFNLGGAIQGNLAITLHGNYILWGFNKWNLYNGSYTATLASNASVMVGRLTNEWVPSYPIFGLTITSGLSSDTWQGGSDSIGFVPVIFGIDDAGAATLQNSSGVSITARSLSGDIKYPVKYGPL